MEFYIPGAAPDRKGQKTAGGDHYLQCGERTSGRVLRRCIFHYIEFPDAEEMRKILDVHFEHLDEDLVTQALKSFYYIRSLLTSEKPSTSELIDWLRALHSTAEFPRRQLRIRSRMPELLKKDKDL